MKKHIPNILTCVNLLIGCVGVYFTITGTEPSAFYFVVAAGIFDFLDGFMARILKSHSPFGKQLDSLADLVSFGMLPSFFMLQWIQDSSEYFWMALIIVIFSALRLAKFNIDDSQSSSFMGLPTPANALMLTSLIFVPFELYPSTLISITLLSAMLLVSPFRLLALKFSSWGWRENESRWILIMGVVILLVIFRWAFLPFLIPYYLVISVISYWIKGRV